MQSRIGKEYNLPMHLTRISKLLIQVLDSMSEAEKAKVVIVVAMMDRAKHVRLERARLFYRKFRFPVDSGLIQIVAPSQNIYPVNNYTAMHRYKTQTRPARAHIKDLEKFNLQGQIKVLVGPSHFFIFVKEKN